MPKLAVFQSTSKQDGSPGYRERSGWRVRIEQEFQDEDGTRMYHIRFLKDSVETVAFENELKELANQHQLSPTLRVGDNDNE